MGTKRTLPEEAAGPRWTGRVHISSAAGDMLTAKLFPLPLSGLFYVGLPLIFSCCYLR